MKHPGSAVFRIPIFLHSADFDAMNHTQKFIRMLLCGVLLLLMFCGCGENLLLPTGGYDYSMSAIDGTILGYPIPRSGPNPYCYDRTAPSSMLPPTAFVYDADHMEYAPLPVNVCTLPVPGSPVSAYSVEHDERGMTFFASSDIHSTVFQGDIGGRAVVLADGVLYLANEAEAAVISNDVADVLAVHTERQCLLFCDSTGLLYEYRNDFGEDRAFPISDGMSVADAWYVYSMEAHTVVFRSGGAWYYTEDGGSPIPCICPERGEKQSCVYVRGTCCILQGNSDSAYFYDIRTGVVVAMDMGGLYRFPQNTDTVTLPLSPDGMFVYFYDIDFIYRLNLETGNLDLAYNEAPIFEGSCILSSMTAVTDEIVLLSQAANEYTEYVATITCAVFEEDIPDVRHEDEKIDLDYHPWQTEDE